MISEHYHTNACKTDDAFTALMPTKIFLLWVIVGSLVDVFQEGGWRMSAECAHFI
jgi:hypothetical protein